MKNIGFLLPPKLLKKNFKIIRPQNLFGPNWDNLSKMLCPHCSCRLYAMRNGKMLCKSKSHKGGKVFSPK